MLFQNTPVFKIILNDVYFHSPFFLWVNLIFFNAKIQENKLSLWGRIMIFFHFCLINSKSHQVSLAFIHFNIVDRRKNGSVYRNFSVF